MKYTKTKYPNIFSYETKKGNRYMVRRGYFQCGKKKEISKSGLKTLGEARKVLSDIETKIENNEFDQSKNLTLNQYWEVYYHKRATTGYWAPNTEYSVVNVYNTHFKDVLGPIKLKDLNRNRYELLINDKLKVCTRNTVRQIHGNLMAILNDAVLNGNLAFNYLQKIHIGESSKATNDKKITLEQYLKWRETSEELLDKYDWAFVYLTTFGLRNGEIMALRAFSISYNEQGRAVLHITDSRGAFTPEGRGKPKTLSSIRYVTLDDTGTDLIKYALKESRRRKSKKGMILNKNDFLYVSEKFGKPYDINQLRVLFRAVEKHLDFHITPHMLRHFFATQSVIAGVPVEHLSSYLGHSRVEITQKYTHIADEISLSVVDTFKKSIQ